MELRKSILLDRFTDQEGEGRCCDCKKAKATVIRHSRPSSKIRSIEDCKTEAELADELLANKVGPESYYLLSVCRKCYNLANPDDKIKCPPRRIVEAPSKKAKSQKRKRGKNDDSLASAAEASCSSAGEPKDELLAEQQRIALQILIEKRRKREQEERDKSPDEWEQAVIDVDRADKKIAKQSAEKKRKKEEQGLDEWGRIELQLQREDEEKARKRAAEATVAAAAAAYYPAPDPRIPSFTPFRKRD